MNKLSSITDFIVTEEFNRLDFLNRFNGKYTQIKESVTTHSWWVVTFTILTLAELFPQEDKKILKLKYDTLTHANFHDYLEIWSFDVSFEVKYNESYGREIRELIKALEVSNARLSCFDKDNNCNSKVADMVFNSSVDIDNNLSKLIVKFADWMALIKHIYRELDLGNLSLKYVMGNALRGINNVMVDLQIEYGNYCVDNNYDINSVFLDKIRIELEPFKKLC